MYTADRRTEICSIYPGTTVSNDAWKYFILFFNVYYAHCTHCSCYCLVCEFVANTFFSILFRLLQIAFISFLIQNSVCVTTKSVSKLCFYISGFLIGVIISIMIYVFFFQFTFICLHILYVKYFKQAAFKISVQSNRET